MLLTQIGLPFRTRPSDVDENEVAENSPTTACYLAEKKAGAVSAGIKNHWILGADTMVVLGETVLGKPEDIDHAYAMLIQLSGKEHKVVTGFCLLDPSCRPVHSEEITTNVRMKRLTEEEIMAYVGTGEPFGKAGSYAIQGIGAFMVEAISGSYTNVVGLPICALIRALITTGALKGFPMRRS
jgi:septum formation protein